MSQPRVWSGAFAVVYKALRPDRSPIAVRAFTSYSEDRHDHYDRITEYLRARPLHCLTNFEYREAAIRSAGDGRWYPLVTMDWVEGMTLFNWVQQRCRVGKGSSLAKATRHWVRLVRELQHVRIAHGDLQHANVMVTPQGRLKLVDYDGMCVPALFGKTNLETGLPPYQHPDRDAQTPLSPNLDNFSSLVIYTALLALAADTSLWKRHVVESGYDKLLFRSEDLAAPDSSPLCSELEESANPEVRSLSRKLCAYAQGPLSDVPSLDSVLSDLGNKMSMPAPKPPNAPLVAGPKTGGESNDDAPRVVLRVASGPICGTSFVIDRHDTLLFGRGSDCHARIRRDPEVSRHHFLLEAIPPMVVLRDLGSRNGTFVNGVRLGDPSKSPEENSELQLSDGDRIVVGSTEITVNVFSERPSASPPPIPLPTPVHDAAVATEDLSRDRCIDHLTIEEELTRDRLGVIHRGVDERDGQRVLLRLFQPQGEVSPQEREYIVTTLSQFAGLEHPHLVRQRAAGELRGRFYLVTEECPGQDLETWLKDREERITLQHAKPIMRQCLDALRYAHSVGMVHGGLLPTDVFVQLCDKRLTVTIANFGVRRCFERVGLSGLSTTGGVRLDFQYTPPERLTDFQANDPESDLWSVAATFYRLLAGAAPYDFQHRDPVSVILKEGAVPLRDRNPQIPPVLAQVIDRGLAISPEARYHTAIEMQRSVDRAFEAMKSL